MASDRNQERKRKRRRETVLIHRLRLQAEVLCESHGTGRQEIAKRMLPVLLELLTVPRVNDQRRKELADVLAGASYGDDQTIWVEGDEIFIHGSFGVKDLAKRMVWGKGNATFEGDYHAEESSESTVDSTP